MTEQTVSCPKCGTGIKLTESLAAPLVATVRAEYEQKLAVQNQSVIVQQQALARREAELQRERAEVEERITQQVAAQLSREKQALIDREAAKARAGVQGELDRAANEVRDRDDRLQQLDAKLATAQAAQADLLKKERELDDARREFELKLQQGIASGLEETRARALREVQDTLDLKVKDRDNTIGQLRQQIDLLQRKAEQGSQQAQGEALELALEQQLRTQFPTDIIEPVAKGEFGGDVLQHVRDQSGQHCGMILWESKRTKAWSDTWLPKLRADQRSAGAEFAVIVSQTMPKGVPHFNQVDGVWVSNLSCALPVAVALRVSLIDMAALRRAGEGQETKVQQVYAYLTGPKFRHRVQSIAEKFTDMRDDLDKERKMMTKQWAKREEQIRCVLEATAGMYGDLQGIAGRSLKEIDGLAAQMLLSDMV